MPIDYLLDGFLSRVLYIAKYTSKKVYRNFIGFTSYFLMLSALSILTFFLFGIHLNVFFIAVAFYVIDRIFHLSSNLDSSDYL